jgi:hypothetical protein
MSGRGAMTRSPLFWLAPATVTGALTANFLIEAWLLWRGHAPITVEVRHQALLRPGWVITGCAGLVALGALLGHLASPQDNLEEAW